MIRHTLFALARALAMGSAGVATGAVATFVILHAVGIEL
jgi:hypothetical protein